MKSLLTFILPLLVILGISSCAKEEVVLEETTLSSAGKIDENPPITGGDDPVTGGDDPATNVFMSIGLFPIEDLGGDQCYEAWFTYNFNGSVEPGKFSTILIRKKAFGSEQTVYSKLYPPSAPLVGSAVVKKEICFEKTNNGYDAEIICQAQSHGNILRRDGCIVVIEPD